jgi:hypothetical protein
MGCKYYNWWADGGCHLTTGSSPSTSGGPASSGEVNCTSAANSVCWVRMPTGCGNALSETTTPTAWFIDPSNGGGTSCSASRLAAFNSHCSKSDAENYFGVNI